MTMHTKGSSRRNHLPGFARGASLWAISVVLCIAVPLCAAQSPDASTDPFDATGSLASNSAATAASDQAPLTDRERVMLDRIRSLEQRLAAVESKVSSAPMATGNPAQETVAPSNQGAAGSSIAEQQASASEQTSETQSSQQTQSNQKTSAYEEWKKPSSPDTFDTLEPGNGFKVAKSDLGDLNISAYVLLRYINQLPANQTFVDHLGNVQTVNPRNDIHSHRILVFFKGFLFNPRFNYTVFVWTVNATGQVTVVGNLDYKFSKRFVLSGGINGFPGSRSMLGSHPYWLGHDRVMADEFFRPGC